MIDSLPAGLSVNFSLFSPGKLVDNQLLSSNKTYEFNRRSSSCTTMATRRSDQAMDHSHSPLGAAVSLASAQLRMGSYHSHLPHGAAVSSASAQLRMAGTDNDGTPHARGRRGHRDNPPSHLHGAPSAMYQPTSSRGCGDHPHSYPPHHEGMRDQSLSFSSERDGDINGLKTPTSATFPTRSVSSSTKRPTASSTIRHPRLDDSYALLLLPSTISYINMIMLLPPSTHFSRQGRSVRSTPKHAYHIARHC